jgi:hypothetical protein
MSLTLELPSALSEELAQQAGLIGVSPEEHATGLLYLAAGVLGIEDPDSLEASADDYLATIPVSKTQAVAIFEWLTRRLLEEGVASERDFERLSVFAAKLRTWLETHARQGHSPHPPVPSRPSAMGKYAHIPGTSEDFARLKQAEIDLEDGRAA